MSIPATSIADQVPDRPLAPAALRLWLQGVLMMPAGLAFAVVAVATESFTEVVTGISIMTSTMAAVVYFGQRSAAATSAAAVSEVTTRQVERRSRTCLKLLLVPVVIVSVMLAWFAITELWLGWGGFSWALFSGLTFGFGLSFVLLSRWLRRWELEHGRVIVEDSTVFRRSKMHRFLAATPSDREL